MAPANLTGQARRNSLNDPYCLNLSMGSLHGKLMFLIALNSLLCLVAILENALILVALYKRCSLHPPSKLLIGNLATTDFAVGIVVEPLFLIYLISLSTTRWNICKYAFFSLRVVSCSIVSVSLITLTAISVDRFLALKLGLAYKQVVTVSRTSWVLIISWAVSIAFSTMYPWKYLITIWYGVSIIGLCVTVIAFCYTKILLTLRRNQIDRPEEKPKKTVSLRRLRYRKTLSSLMWLQLALVVCYLPQGVVDSIVNEMDVDQDSLISKARFFTATLVFFNSSLNPILYCWKIKEVRKAVKDTIRRLFLR